MKTIVLIMLVAATSASTPIHDGDIFNIYDMKKIMETEKLRKEAFGCLMGRSPCEKYQLIKDRAPNIFRTRCADCTSEQKDIFEKLMKQFEVEHNDAYKEILARFARQK